MTDKSRRVRFEEWSLRDCIKKCSEEPGLAIPAFQRGAVWDDAMKARFFESLASGYFVGSLLIWQPGRDPGTGAVRLGGRGDGPAGKAPLIVDGQQRLRTLLDAWGEGREETRPAQGAIWCVGVEPGHGLRFKRQDFRTGRYAQKPGRKTPCDWLPLGLMLREALARDHAATFYYLSREIDEADRRRQEVKRFTGQTWCDEFAPEARQTRTDLRGRLKSMLEHRLSVAILRSEDGWKQPDVIENYRRLNEGGAKLRPEELEYARLVSAVGPRVDDALDRVLKSRPGGGRDTTSDGGDSTGAESVESEGAAARDERLHRGDERDFGLKMLVRAVGLARDYMTNEPHESGKPLPDRPTPPDGSTQDAAAEEAWRKNIVLWLEMATDCVVALSEVLAGLHVDDRRRIPQRFRGELGPLIFLLLRFPELRTEAGRVSMAYVVLLQLLLTTETDAKGLAHCVLGASTARDAIDRLKAKYVGEVDDEANKALSHQHRYVQLLYWLLRKRVAKDIPKSNPADAQWLGNTGNQEPERQHIVPYMRVLYPPDQPKPRRGSSHHVNSLGNTTWISRASNGFDGGWSDDFMKVDPESQGPHFLDGQGADDYASICPDEAARANVELDVLERFVKARTPRIAAAFKGWLRDLEAELQNQQHEGKPCPRPGNVFDAMVCWGYPADLAECVDREIMRPTNRQVIYSHGTTSPAWKNAAYTRLRWAQKQEWHLLSPPRIEFDVRLPHEESLSPERKLIISDKRLEIPRRDGAADVRYPSSCADGVSLLEALLHVEPAHPFPAFP
jgi:hypothetical protein